MNFAICTASGRAPQLLWIWVPLQKVQTEAQTELIPPYLLILGGVVVFLVCMCIVPRIWWMQKGRSDNFDGHAKPKEVDPEIGVGDSTTAPQQLPKELDPEIGFDDSTTATQ